VLNCWLYLYCFITSYTPS